MMVTIWSQNGHTKAPRFNYDPKSLDRKSELVRSAGVEPTTLGFGNRYSIQLSYERVFEKGTETTWRTYGHFTSQHSIDHKLRKPILYPAELRAHEWRRAV